MLGATQAIQLTSMVLMLTHVGTSRMPERVAGMGMKQEPAQAQKAPLRPAALGVEELLKDPRAHAGQVRVEGVVGGFFDVRAGTGRQMTIIDLKEFAHCGVSNCAMYTLTSPIAESAFNGGRPWDGTQVVVVGELLPEGKTARLYVNQVLQDGKVVLERLPLSPSALLLRQAELGLGEDQRGELAKLGLDLAAENQRLEALLTARTAENKKAQHANEVERGHLACERLRIEIRDLTEKIELRVAALLTVDQRAKVVGSLASNRPR